MTGSDSKDRLKSLQVVQNDVVLLDLSRCVCNRFLYLLCARVGPYRLSLSCYVRIQKNLTSKLLTSKIPMLAPHIVWMNQGQFHLEVHG